MRQIILGLLLFFASYTLSAREVFNLNEGWHFSSSFNTTKEYKLINLPHVWCKGDQSISQTGLCYYLKEFKVPSQFSTKKIYLRFGGVGSVATLYINGKYVSEHKGAFTAFNVDVTQFIRCGEYNSIMVAVANTPRIDLLPFMSDQNIYGGIHSDVELIVLDQNHISLSHYGSKGVYLSTKSTGSSSAEVAATIRLEGAPSATIGVDINIYNDGEKVASNSRNVRLNTSGEGSAVMTLNIDNPTLWQGVDNPHLYDVTVQTRVYNAVTDSLHTKLGIRKVNIDSENRFVLNDTPMRLQGVNVVQDNSLAGSTYTKNDFNRDVELINEMGATAVRTIGGAHSDYAFNLYDKNGIVTWVDLPLSSDIVYGGKGFADQYQLKENGREQLRELIYQLYNHPSVCFIGIFNELTSTGDNPIEYIRELNGIVGSENSDLITVASSIEDGAINTITEAISWPIYFGWDKGECSDLDLWIKQIKNNFSHLKGAISEYGTAADVNGVPSLEDNSIGVIKKENKVASYPQNSQSLFHESYYKSIKKGEAFWGTFINSMFEFSNSDSDIKSESGHNNMGLVSYDRNHKKDAFYFYKANWNDIDPFVHITNRNFDRRANTTQSIKAYTNQAEAKLIVNEVLISTLPVEDGIVEWKDIEFKQGTNRITVIADRQYDVIEIEIFNDLLAQ